MGIMCHQIHIPMSQAIADPIHGKDTIAYRSGGSQGDQAVHIGGTVGQRLKAYAEKFPVHVKNGQQ